MIVKVLNQDDLGDEFDVGNIETDKVRLKHDETIERLSDGTLRVPGGAGTRLLLMADQPFGAYQNGVTHQIYLPEDPSYGISFREDTPGQPRIDLTRKGVWTVEHSAILRSADAAADVNSDALRVFMNITDKASNGNISYQEYGFRAMRPTSGDVPHFYVNTHNTFYVDDTDAVIQMDYFVNGIGYDELATGFITNNIRFLYHGR